MKYKTERTSHGLRDVLFNEIDALVNGESTPHRAIAVSKLATQIVNCANMEVEYQKLTANNMQYKGELLSTPIALGTPE